jgi:hypothetical protein
MWMKSGDNYTAGLTCKAVIDFADILAIEPENPRLLMTRRIGMTTVSGVTIEKRVKKGQSENALTGGFLYVLQILHGNVTGTASHCRRE